MSCPSRASRSGRQRGLTLMELLVSMAILSLVMALVAQAVSQTALVARAAQDSAQELHSSWNKGWVLRDLFSNLAAAPEGGDEPLKGAADRISGLSLASISGTAQGVQAFRLRLERDRQSQQTLLIDELWAPTGGGEPRPAVIARFDKPVEFAFQDAAGRLHDEWPTAAFDPKDVHAAVLPRAIVLRESQNKEPLMWYPFQGETRRLYPRPKMFWEN